MNEPIVLYVQAENIEQAAEEARKKMGQCVGVVEVGARLEGLRGFMAFKGKQEMKAIMQAF